MTAAGCWQWLGYITEKGYGTVAPGPGSRYAHRRSYEAHVGPIPEGLQIDHLCRNRACVNPEHLEPVTAAENVRRAAAVREVCPQGHPLDGVRRQSQRGGRLSRYCKTCNRERVYARRRQQVSA